MVALGIMQEIKPETEVETNDPMIVGETKLPALFDNSTVKVFPESMEDPGKL